MNEQQQLFEYRLDQAVTILAEAENMLKSFFFGQIDCQIYETRLLSYLVTTISIHE